MTQARLIEAVDLRPMEAAPRDGSYIIGVTRHDLEDRWSGDAARPFVIWHMGRTRNLNLDWGWSLYPGMVVGDDWFAGWVPLPFDLDRAAILRAMEGRDGRWRVMGEVLHTPPSPAKQSNEGRTSNATPRERFGVRSKLI